MAGIDWNRRRFCVPPDLAGVSPQISGKSQQRVPVRLFPQPDRPMTVNLIGSRIRIQADQSCDQNCQEQLPANAFDDCEAPSYLRAGHDVAITERCQCDEAEIDCTRLGEMGAGGEGARADLFENPIQETEANSRKQIGAGAAYRCSASTLVARMAERRAATVASIPIRAHIPRVIADKTVCPSQSVSGRASQAMIMSTSRRDRPFMVSAGIIAARRLAATNDSNSAPLNSRALRSGATTIVKRSA